jgi:hypothetical protein
MIQVSNRQCGPRRVLPGLSINDSCATLFEPMELPSVGITKVSGNDECAKLLVGAHPILISHAKSHAKFQTPFGVHER